MKKSGMFVYLLASERSERDTYRGKNEKIGDVCLFIYLYICLDVCMSFCTLTLRIFVFARRSTPSQTSLDRILLFSDHYPYHLKLIVLLALNCFWAGAVFQTQILWTPFSMRLVAVVS